MLTVVGPVAGYELADLLLREQLRTLLGLLNELDLLMPEVPVEIRLLSLKHRLEVQEFTLRIAACFVLAQRLFPEFFLLMVQGLDLSVATKSVLELDSPAPLNCHDRLYDVDSVRTADGGLQLVVELLVIEDHARGDLFDFQVKVEVCDAINAELNLVVVKFCPL